MQRLPSTRLWPALWLLLASSAAAQPLGDVLVVPYGAPDLGGSLNAAAELETRLAAERISLLATRDARDRFNARSRPPQTTSAADLAILTRAADAALEHVAFGRTAAAQKSVREMIAAAEPSLETLNRDTPTAQRLFDACLSLVRSALQGNDRKLALEEAARCRRWVPDLKPSEEAHPANVVGVLREVDDSQQGRHVGRLTVTSAGASHCSAYINGRRLGTTPFILEPAAAGDYRVQVECDHAPARVHTLQLGDQPTTLIVDSRFDHAVSSEARLALQYQEAGEARERSLSDAVQLGREVGASDVILVHMREGAAELSRVNVKEQQLVVRAVVPSTADHGFSQSALASGITALATPDDVEPPGYRETVEDAVSEMAAHNYEEARALFARAHQLSPSARTFRDLGSAEFELRNYEAAIDQLDAPLSSNVKPLEGDLRLETDRLLKRARAYVGLVDVVSVPPATEILVDESFSRQADAPLRLKAGAHVLDLTIPGHPPVRRHVVVRGGERKTLRVDVATPLDPHAERTERRWYKSPWLWTAVGLAAAGAAVGVALAARDPGTRTSDASGGSTGVYAFGPGRAP